LGFHGGTMTIVRGLTAWLIRRTPGR
jgi:hypothetical protein